MALSKVPIVPVWNLSNGCVATSDGGFLYIGSKTINYISKVTVGSSPVIKVFHTRQNILSLAIDPGWCNGESSTKHFAVLAQDNSVQIWDFDKSCAVSGHKAHFQTMSVEGNGMPPHDRVLLCYMKHRNVLSIGSTDIVVYCVASNSYCRKPSFIPARNQHLTVLRCSPYNENIFAVGTNRGLVLVCDLQKMRIIYTLRGHDAPITALSWIIVDKNSLTTSKKKVNTPEKSEQRNKNKSAINNALFSCANDDIFDIYDYDYLENEFGAPTNEPDERIAGVEFVGIEKPQESTSTKFDFVEACQSLREEIDAIKDEHSTNDEVTLKDCQQVENKAEMSSSCDSTEGSLELIDRSSDDDVDVDGVQPKVAKSLSGNLVSDRQQIIHKAEVHSTQTLERRDEKLELPIDSLPKTFPNNSDEMTNDILLASASVDATFWIWNTKTGSACDHLRGRSSGQAKKNTHVEIVWIDSENFLTTNRVGDIVWWTMMSQESSNHRYKYVEQKRQFSQRGVVSFSICKGNDLLWTISSYREIGCEELMSKRLIAKYCCASTNVSAMCECPDDMNKIALGFSDRRIGIIDISKISSTNVTIENFSQRIDASVLALVWSPDNKKLAFGTVEGRVGIINVENLKLTPFIFNPFCGKPIYSMDWKENYIYVCCNEMLGVYDDQGTNKDSYILHSIVSVSTISVRGDFLFVGTQRGGLQVFRRRTPQKLDYELLQEIKIGPRYITDIAWSPIACELFAVISMTNGIHVFNFDAATATVKPVRKIEIKNPKNANSCIKWSNRNKNEFLTCGFDGGVRIWDLSSNNEDEKFLKSFPSPMTCGLFLPTDEQIVICAGKFTSVELFNMSIEKSESECKRVNANTTPHVKWALKIKTHPETKASTAKEKRRQLRASAKDEVMKETHASCVKESSQTIKKNEDITNMLDSLKIERDADNFESEEKFETVSEQKSAASIYMKNPVTLLYLTTKEINKNALEKLIFILSRDNDKHSTKSTLTAKLFNRKCDAKVLLEEELLNHHHSKTKGIASLLMPQLKSSMKEEIIKCIQNKQLDEWHVSLAPSISYNFWQKCCQAFAEQLMEQGYALQAATYLTALHKQSEAIQMLIEKNYFKEALLMARVYLQEDDPLLQQIINKWISYLDSTGNLTGAAYLYTLSGQIGEAYRTLLKVRNAPPNVEQALELLKSHEKCQ